MKPIHISRMIFVSLVMSLLLVACSGGPQKGSTSPVDNSEPSSELSMQSAVPAEAGSDLFTAPADPLKVSITLDSVSETARIIGVEGGTLNATGADGSVFTLEIPPGALLVPTEIVLTPVTSIDGLPETSTFGAAVQLEPDGLRLYEFATLTVQPPRDIPLEEQVLIGYAGQGQDVHMVPPVVGADDIQMKLLHFSGYGIVQESDPFRVGYINRRTVENQARLSQAMAELLQKEHQAQKNGQPSDPEFVEKITRNLQNYYNQVIRPRLMTATSSCANGQKALQTYFEFERQKQLLGITNEIQTDNIDMAVLQRQVALKCMEEAYQRCEQEHVLEEIMPLALGYERQRQLLGTADENAGFDPEIWAFVEKCYRFELEFDSADGVNNEGTGWDSAVKARVPIRVTDMGLKMKFAGQGPLESMYYTTTWGDDQATILENLHEGDVFEVLGLRFIFNRAGKIFTLELDHYPGKTTEQDKVRLCDEDGMNCITISQPSSPGPVWTGIFTAFHMNEISGGGSAATGAMPGMGDISSIPGAQDYVGDLDLQSLAPSLGMLGTSTEEQVFTAQNWKLQRSEVYAIREYDYRMKDTGMYERTIMTLHHTPGK